MKRKVKKTEDLSEKERQRHRLTFECLRAIKGIPTSVIAKKSGVSYQTIRNLRRPVHEGGTLAPRVSTMSQIGRAVGWELKWLPRTLPMQRSNTTHSINRPSLALN